MRRIGLFTILCIAFSTAFAAENTEDAKYLIKFKGDVSQSEALKTLKESGFVFERLLSEISVYVAEPAPSVREVDAVKELESTKQTLYIEKNDYRWRAIGAATPNDPDYSKQYGLPQISADKAWDRATGSHEIVVAVSDTGVAYGHSDLAAQMWVNSGEIPGNGVDDDGNGYVDDVKGWDFAGKDSDPDDDNGHGTHVAGIIGAEGNNGVGVSGVNWRVSIMPVKFLAANGSGSTLDGVDSILYAVNNGARVINCSWGSTQSSAALEDALKYANDKKVLVLAAAGNSSADTDSRPHYPSSYNVPSVVSVAATSQGSSLASFSNYGKSSVDVGAPGASIYATYPPDTYKSLSGTSMATPMVAGVAALVLSHRSSLDVIELRNLLFNAVNVRTSLADKTATEGEVDADLALTQVEDGFQLWPLRMTVKKGDMFQFTAYNASGSVTWSVSNSSVGTVNADGEFHALAAGNVVVSAQDQSGTKLSTTSVRVIETGSGGQPGCNFPLRKGEVMTPEQTASNVLSFGLPFMIGYLIRVGRRKFRR